jgi:hypothetical protein
VRHGAETTFIARQALQGAVERPNLVRLVDRRHTHSLTLTPGARAWPSIIRPDPKPRFVPRRPRAAGNRRRLRGRAYTTMTHRPATIVSRVRPPGPARARVVRVIQSVSAILVALCLLRIVGSIAHAEDLAISSRRAAERKNFTDAEIADGFFKVAFGAELGLGGRVDRIRKYVRPVRIFIESRATPDRRKALANVVHDITSRIANVDIAITSRRTEANFVVRLVRDRDLTATVRELYGSKSNQIIRKLDPQCLSGFRKDAQYRITVSDVILVVDAGDFVFYDCAYEEMLQALGPIRDDPTVPWTMFNDKVRMGFFDVYDQYVLNILYDPRILPGMTRDEVRAALPKVMPTVRAFVAKNNGLGP